MKSVFRESPDPVIKELRIEVGGVHLVAVSLVKFNLKLFRVSTDHVIEDSLDSLTPVPPPELTTLPKSLRPKSQRL